MLARRPFATALLIALLVLPFAGSASAHADLASSVPAAGATLTRSPATVTAVFDNESELRAEGSSLRVTNAAGAVVDRGDSALDRNDPARKTLVVSLQPNLPDGVYTVEWTAVSDADGETEEGTFSFTVRAAQSATATASPASATPAATPTAPTALPATGAESHWPGTILGLVALIAGVAGLALRRRAAR